MADQILRDRNNRYIGKIRQLNDGRFEGRDVHNLLRGYYDPKRNETRDMHGRIIGKGNLLATLIVDVDMKHIY